MDYSGYDLIEKNKELNENKSLQEQTQQSQETMQHSIYTDKHMFEADSEFSIQSSLPVLIPETAPQATLHQTNRWDEKRNKDNAKMMRKVQKKQEEITNLKLKSLAANQEDISKDYFKKQEQILSLLKKIEINKAKNARGYDEQKTREIDAVTEEKRAALYGELARYAPKGEKQNAIYKLKEKAQIKQHKLLKRNAIEKIENPVERQRELNTFKRHEMFDRLKGIFYTPSKFACEGYTHEQGNKKLVNVGRAFMGGTKPMYYFEDRNDPIKDQAGNVVGYRKYLYKEAVNCIGFKKPQGAIVTEAASKLQQIVCGEYAIPAFEVKNEKGEAIGSFQEMIEQKDKKERIDLFKWQAAPDNSLTAEIKDEILREHTLDWLLCNFDTKGENFLHRKSDGHLSSFDKEASFSHITDREAQQMSRTYSPHSNDTLYNTIFQEYVKGTLDLDFKPVLKRAEEIQGMSDDEYMKLFDEMLNQKYPNAEKREEVRGLILKRKTGLVKEYERFFNQLKTDRENGPQNP